MTERFEMNEKYQILRCQNSEAYNAARSIADLTASHCNTGSSCCHDQRAEQRPTMRQDCLDRNQYHHGMGIRRH